MREESQFHVRIHEKENSPPWTHHPDSLPSNKPTRHRGISYDAMRVLTGRQHHLRPEIWFQRPRIEGLGHNNNASSCHTSPPFNQEFTANIVGEDMAVQSRASALRLGFSCRSTGIASCTQTKTWEWMWATRGKNFNAILEFCSKRWIWDDEDR